MNVISEDQSNRKERSLRAFSARQDPSQSTTDFTDQPEMIAGWALSVVIRSLSLIMAFSCVQTGPRNLQEGAEDAEALNRCSALSAPSCKKVCDRLVAALPRQEIRGQDFSEIWLRLRRAGFFAVQLPILK